MACKLAHSAFLFLGPHKRPNETSRIPPRSSTSSGTYLLNGKQKQCLISFRKHKIVKAVAVPMSPSSAADNAEYRQQLCHEYGFRQMGEPLPDNVTIRDIIDTLPRKVFGIKFNDAKAWKSVLITVTSYALGIVMIAKAQWFLLPLAWAWTGTAITGAFAIGHDCAHKIILKE